MNATRFLSLFGGGPFTPLRLFRGNEQGFFFVNDISTMYQDSAGTTPAAVDQPVGKWLDVSGRGNHATQATSANRPTLKQDTKGNYYVHFNGTNQWMQTGSVDFTGTDKMTVFAGVTRNTDGAAQTILELSASFALAGGMSLFAFTGTPDSYVFASNGSSAAQAGGGAVTAPVSSVLCGQGDIANDRVSLRMNGIQVASSAVDQGTGNYANAVCNIGARNGGASLFLNGDIYCLGARGAATTDTLIAQAERYVSGRMGGGFV